MKEKNMVDLNPNRGDRFSQVNNKLRAMSACFATSVTQCLFIRKYDLSILVSYAKNVPSEQPEDGLGWFIDHDPEVQANWKKWHPKELDTPAYLWGDCMAFAVNKLFGAGTAVFVPDLTYSKIVSYLDRSIPCCFSGKYEGIKGHYVTTVGYTENNLLIDDPYGNTLKNGSKAGQNSSEGYHVVYTRDDYDRVSKNYGLRIE
jgi:hypothetical protein